jgi:hypothetical protein
MAGASRRGYGEDGIYVDHRDDCRNLPYGREAALGAGCGGGLVTVLTRSFHQSMHSFAETLKSIAEGTVTWMTG